MMENELNVQTIAQEDGIEPSGVALGEEELVQEEGGFSNEPINEPFRLLVKFNHQEIALDEETARTLAQKGLNYDKVKASLDLLQNEGNEKGEATENELIRFFESYPQINAEDIPDAVLEQYEKGTPIAFAYERFIKEQEIDRLKEELDSLKTVLAVEKTNSENKDTATGSVSCFGGVQCEELYTEEELNSLSKKELNGNLDKALKSMTYWSQKRINN